MPDLIMQYGPWLYLAGLAFAVLFGWALCRAGALADRALTEDRQVEDLDNQYGPPELADTPDVLRALGTK